MSDKRQMNGAVELWHASESDAELHDFLGLTWTQYAAWVTRGELPGGYELPTRTKQDVSAAGAEEE